MYEVGGTPAAQGFIRKGVIVFQQRIVSDNSENGRCITFGKATDNRATGRIDPDKS